MCVCARASHFASLDGFEFAYCKCQFTVQKLKTLYMPHSTER